MPIRRGPAFMSAQCDVALGHFDVTKASLIPPDMCPLWRVKMFCVSTCSIVSWCTFALPSPTLSPKQTLYGLDKGTQICRWIIKKATTAGYVSFSNAAQTWENQEWQTRSPTWILISFNITVVLCVYMCVHKYNLRWTIKSNFWFCF